MTQNHITPAHKLTNLVKHLGVATLRSGSILRYGASERDPDNGPNALLNRDLFVRSLIDLKLAIQVIEEDIMQASAAAAAQKAVELSIPDRPPNSKLAEEDKKI